MKPPSPFTIRDGRQNDAEELLTLIGTCLKDYGLSLRTDEVDACVLDVTRHYQDPGGTFELLLADDRIIGCYGLMPHEGKTAELRKMYLHPDYRGKGLGRWLMDRALARARALGFTRLELETASVLKEALGLYQAYGFTPLKRTDIPERCDMAMGLDL